MVDIMKESLENTILLIIILVTSIISMTYDVTRLPIASGIIAIVVLLNKMKKIDIKTMFALYIWSVFLIVIDLLATS